MLLDMLAYAMQKYRNHATFSPAAKSKRLTTVFFDKDRGAEVAIRALGGEYYRIRAGESSGWNPFALESTRRNRIHAPQVDVLVKWLAEQHINGF